MNRILRSVMLAGVMALGGTAGAIGPQTVQPVDGETDLGFFYSLGDSGTPFNKRKFVTMREPQFEVAKNTVLDEDEQVIGLTDGGTEWCFPIRLMTYHHIARVPNQPGNLVVTYCAMANSAVAFRPYASWGNGTKYGMDLQVAGSYSGTLVVSRNFTYIYNSPTAEAYFPQINPAAPIPDVSPRQPMDIGPPLSITTYGLWRRKFPETLVLQPVPKFADKYAEYDAKPKGYSILKERDRTIKMQDKRLSPGREVYGVAMGQESSAWSIEEVEHRKQIFVPMGGEVVHIVWDQELKTPVVVNPPEGIIATRCYWYSWSSFYPGGPLNGKFAVPGEVVALPKPQAEPAVETTTVTASQITGRAEK